ncbi:glycoside hydrolase family 97 N-terminal domain-containing protein [Bacteroides uniformis]|nr:glycoside hydrolase family 97 N-terminal domain-containing protein [Bacteroides uniformis]
MCPPILPWYRFSPAEVLCGISRREAEACVGHSTEKVAYSVKYGKQQLLEDSRLGFEFDSGEFGAGLKAERYKGGK